MQMLLTRIQQLLEGNKTVDYFTSNWAHAPKQGKCADHEEINGYTL